MPELTNAERLEVARRAYSDLGGDAGEIQTLADARLVLAPLADSLDEDVIAAVAPTEEERRAFRRPVDRPADELPGLLVEWVDADGRAVGGEGPAVPAGPGLEVWWEEAREADEAAAARGVPGRSVESLPGLAIEEVEA